MNNFGKKSNTYQKPVLYGLGLMLAGVTGYLIRNYVFADDCSSTQKTSSQVVQQPNDSLQSKIIVKGDYFENGSTQMNNNTTKKEYLIAPKKSEQLQKKSTSKPSKLSLENKVQASTKSVQSLDTLNTFIPLDFSGAGENLDIYSPIKKCDSLQVRNYE